MDRPLVHRRTSTCSGLYGTKTAFSPTRTVLTLAFILCCAELQEGCSNTLQVALTVEVLPPSPSFVRHILVRSMSESCRNVVHIYDSKNSSCSGLATVVAQVVLSAYACQQSTGKA